MYKLFLFILLFSFFATCFAQSKLSKWGKAKINYTLPTLHEKRDYSFDGNAGEVITKSFINAYWFLISDEDGDNCPFYPSCSSFFVESVKQTNIFQGILMFTDRFTRDINFVNRAEKYREYKYGKYYDPPSLYLLE